jgi:hypothetical protein
MSSGHRLGSEASGESLFTSAKDFGDAVLRLCLTLRSTWTNEDFLNRPLALREKGLADTVRAHFDCIPVHIEA